MASANPGLTSKFSLPYPKPADPPDIPGDIQALADKVDALLIPFKVWTWEGTAAFNSGEFSVSHTMGAEAVWVGVTVHDASTAIATAYVDKAGFSTIDVRAWTASDGTLFTGQAHLGIIGFWRQP